VRNLDEIGDFGRMKSDILDNIFLVSLSIIILTKGQKPTLPHFTF